MRSQIKRPPLHLDVGRKAQLFVPAADEIRRGDSDADETLLLLPAKFGLEARDRRIAQSARCFRDRDGHIRAFRTRGLSSKIRQDRVHGPAADVQADGIGSVWRQAIHGGRLALAAESFAVFHEVAACDERIDYRRDGGRVRCANLAISAFDACTEPAHGFENDALVVVAQMNRVATFPHHARLCGSIEAVLNYPSLPFF